MNANRLPTKTDQDRLNELIDWYAKHKPDAGHIIQVRFSEEQLTKFGAVKSSSNKRHWAYRERTLERVG